MEKHSTIPKSLKVGKKSFRVSQVPTINPTNSTPASTHGQVRIFRSNGVTSQILVANKNYATGEAHSRDECEATFWHELTHAILDGMGEEALFYNEEFVEKFSRLLHGAIKSAKF